MQCYVIVTSRSLVWLLLTLVSTLAVLSGVLTSRWIVGPSLTYPRLKIGTESISLDAEDTAARTRQFAKSLGIFTRCSLIDGRESCASFAHVGSSGAEGGAGFPGAWQAALVFLSLGLALGVLTTLAALLGCCVQAVCAKKSLFSVAGAIQAAAGVLYIIGMMLFPFGFGSARVQRVCGEESAAFYLAECHLGWSFYVAVCGVLGTFACAVLSYQAEAATSSDRVQEEIDEGKILICLP